ncbi:MAG: hypothetical protein Q8P41_29925 [Pseudomonadota bacterium]|nr:hypothetical protein [Pseudomonadota bacterium]
MSYADEALAEGGEPEEVAERFVELVRDQMLRGTGFSVEFALGAEKPHDWPARRDAKYAFSASSHEHVSDDNDGKPQFDEFSATGSGDEVAFAMREFEAALSGELARLGRARKA